MAQQVQPGVLRTPDSRFENLPSYDFKPNYMAIRGYRVHYLVEAPLDGEVILLIHGEPTCAYLYRKMIPVLTAADYRTIVPDLIGFGRSDKLMSIEGARDFLQEEKDEELAEIIVNFMQNNPL